jgi:hypothetical protein
MKEALLYLFACSATALRRDLTTEFRLPPLPKHRYSSQKKRKTDSRVAAGRRSAVSRPARR